MRYIHRGTMTPDKFNICKTCWNNFYEFSKKHTELIKALELQMRINLREEPPEGLCQGCNQNKSFGYLDVNLEVKRKISLFFEYLICDTCFNDLILFAYENKELAAALNIPKDLEIHEFNTKKQKLCQYCNEEAALGHLYVEKTGNEKKTRQILYIAVYAISVIALILVLPFLDVPNGLENITTYDLLESIGVIGVVMVFVLLLRRIEGARTVLISSFAVVFSIVYAAIILNEIYSIINFMIAAIVLVGLVMVHRL